MSALPEPGQPEIRVPWTDTALDGEAVAAGIAAETDLDRLRDMLVDPSGGTRRDGSSG